MELDRRHHHLRRLGGFYDHVQSPNGTDAIRLGFVIVSPWAKPGYADHSYGTLGSIDAFVEHAFGLQALSARSHRLRPAQRL